MLALISPAKKLDTDNEPPLGDFTMPQLLDDSEELVDTVKGLGNDEMIDSFGCATTDVFLKAVNRALWRITGVRVSGTIMVAATRPRKPNMADTINGEANPHPSYKMPPNTGPKMKPAP